ncbi:MAG: nucleoside recognition protein, partial [Hungatella sp.]
HATRAILLGFVEITTGIQSISSEMEGLQQAFWIVAITAFGGLSGIFQTKSVLKNAGLSIRHYIMWKLLHSLLSCLIFILLRQMFLPVH